MKNIVITGATKGIGRAITEIFAQAGFNVAINARTGADLEQLKAELESKYPAIQVLIQSVDMSQKHQVLHFAEMIRDHWSTIDVLVNNAGVFLPGEITKEEDGALETMIETNLYSAYHLTRALLPLIVPQKQGHIFNICSIASIIAYPNGGSYSISKFAMLGFSKVLREELKKEGIKVTSVMPGATWSASWEGAPFPEDRLMPAEDIANAVWNAYQTSGSTVVEDIILRPQLGDL